MTEHRQPRPLKGYLVNQGRTIGDFANSIGIGRQHVSAVLNHKAPPSEAFAAAAARELGLDLPEVEALLGPRSSWGRGRWPANPDRAPGSQGGGQ